MIRPRRMEAETESLWLATGPATTFAPLKAEVETDVAVIGAGIFGVTTALMLAREGRNVVLLEMDRVGQGVTGHTTAKISSAHGLIYTQVRSRFGREGAAVYADAQQAGLGMIAGMAAELGIECELRRRPAYTYAESAEDAQAIEQEVEAAREAGLPVSLVTDTPLPWPIAAAIRYEDQAEFQPRSFVVGLAEALVAAGGRVHERTRATGVREGSPCAVETDHGAVRADHVVIATHMPFLDRAAFFARVSPERSYVIGARIANEPPAGMFLSTESPAHSVRAHPNAGGELLLVGGESHKVGQSDEVARYEALERWARERFDVASVPYRWSSQDNMPADGIPYVGRLHPLARRLWTATGFRKWGFTNGVAAARIVADAILGLENPWASLFDANRFTPIAATPSLIRENLNVATRLVGDRARDLKPPAAESLAPGEGAIASLDGRTAAVYRTPGGALQAVSPSCTHLGCHVRFNAAERSWDCPCHGSRFATDGTVLHGPAVRDLEPVTQPRRDEDARPDSRHA